MGATLPVPGGYASPSAVAAALQDPAGAAALGSVRQWCAFDGTDGGPALAAGFAAAAADTALYIPPDKTLYINSSQTISRDGAKIYGPGTIKWGPSGQLNFSGKRQGLVGLRHVGALTSDTQFQVAVSDATSYFGSPTYDAGTDGTTTDGTDFTHTLSGTQLTITSTNANIRRVISSEITLNPTKRYVVDWLRGYEVQSEGAITPAFFAYDASHNPLPSNGTTITGSFGRYYPGGSGNGVGSYFFLTGATYLKVVLGVARFTNMKSSVTAIYNLARFRIWQLTNDLAALSTGSWIQDSGHVFVTGEDFECLDSRVEYCDRSFLKDVGGKRTTFARIKGRRNFSALATYQSDQNFTAEDVTDDGRFLDDTGREVPMLALRTGSIVGSGGATGTATGGTASLPTLSSGFSAVTGTYVGLPFYVVGSRDFGRITAYDGSTKTPTIDPPLSAALPNGTSVVIGGTPGAHVRRCVSRGKLWPFEDTGLADVEHEDIKAYQCHAGLSAGGRGNASNVHADLLTFASFGVERTKNSYGRHLTKITVRQHDIGPLVQGINATQRGDECVIADVDIRANIGIFLSDPSTTDRGDVISGATIAYATAGIHTKSGGRLFDIRLRLLASCFSWGNTSVPAGIVCETYFGTFEVNGLKGDGHTHRLMYLSAVQGQRLMGIKAVGNAVATCEIHNVAPGAQADWRYHDVRVLTGLGALIFCSADLPTSSVADLHRVFKKLGVQVTGITNVSAGFITAT